MNNATWQTDDAGRRWPDPPDRGGIDAGPSLDDGDAVVEYHFPVQIEVVRAPEVDVDAIVDQVLRRLGAV